MTAEERNARPNEYGELTSKDYVPGAQVYASLYCDVKINFILDCSLQKCTSLANCLPRTCQWTFVYFQFLDDNVENGDARGEGISKRP